MLIVTWLSIMRSPISLFLVMSLENHLVISRPIIMKNNKTAVVPFSSFSAMKKPKLCSMTPCGFVQLLLRFTVRLIAFFWKTLARPPRNLHRRHNRICNIWTVTARPTGRPDRMSHRKFRETKQQPSRASSGHHISCCLVSLHLLYSILSSHPVEFVFLV